jgi:hypothetical protein
MEAVTSYGVGLNISLCIQYVVEPRSRYGDFLRADRQKDQGSSLGRVKNFQFFVKSRSAIGPNQPIIQLIPGGPFSRDKAAGA